MGLPALYGLQSEVGGVAIELSRADAVLGAVGYVEEDEDKYGAETGGGVMLVAADGAEVSGAEAGADCIPNVAEEVVTGEVIADTVVPAA